MWETFWIKYFDKHEVIVVGVLVEPWVGNQIMGEDFLLLALIDRKRVVSCYYQHAIHPKKNQKSKVNLQPCSGKDLQR